MQKQQKNHKIKNHKNSVIFSKCLVLLHDLGSDMNYRDNGRLKCVRYCSRMV